MDNSALITPPRSHRELVVAQRAGIAKQIAEPGADFAERVPPISFVHDFPVQQIDSGIHDGLDEKKSHLRRSLRNHQNLLDESLQRLPRVAQLSVRHRENEEGGVFERVLECLR